MKTHYASVEWGNESDSTNYWDEPLCGSNSEQVDNNWNCVSCKKCLKLRERYDEEMKRAMEHNVRDMGEFVEFMKKENK